MNPNRGLVCEFEQRWPQPGTAGRFVKQQMRGSLAFLDLFAFLIREVFTDTKKESLWLIMGDLEDRAGSDKSISCSAVSNTPVDSF
jgi:hypothetical protein